MATGVYHIIVRHFKTLERNQCKNLEENLRLKKIKDAFKKLKWNRDVFDAEYLVKKTQADREYEDVVKTLSNLTLNPNVLFGLNNRHWVLSRLDIENKDLFYVTSRGICMRSVKEIPVYGKASAGVKGITLDGDDFVISVTQVDDDTKTEVLAISSFGTYTRKCVGLVRKIARGGRGVKLLDLGDSSLNECLVYANTVSFDSQGLLTIIDRLGVIFHVELESVVSSNKAGKGATLPKIGYVQPLSVYYVRH
jgi:DNA gyrase subunit A